MVIYSPFYHSRPYVDLTSESGIVFGRKALGTSALLEELELRLGLCGKHDSEPERLVKYVHAARKSLQENPALFFGESFTNDELGTVKVLMSWRDALVLALWDRTSGSSEKLKGLASIEKYFVGDGPSDRWVAVLDHVRSCDAVPSGINIECRTEIESLDPCVSKTLKLLSEKGAEVRFVTQISPSAESGTGLCAVQQALLSSATSKKQAITDDSFEIVEFDYAGVAHKKVAVEHDYKDGLVLVCDEPEQINAVRHSLGKATFGSEVSGTPQAQQLFLLGMTLFNNPLNVNNLLSYLRFPVNPLSEAKDANGCPLDVVLRKSLLNNGGIIGWKEILSGDIFDAADDVMDERTKAKVLERISMWEHVGEDNLVPRENLISYLENVESWAARKAVISEEASLFELSRMCTLMKLLLDGTPEMIPSEKVSKWAQGLYGTIQIVVDEAQVGAPDCIPDVRAVVDGSQEMIWVGAEGSKAAAYPYAFLSESERTMLNLPSREKYAAAAYKAVVASLCSVKSHLRIYTYRANRGEICTEHPVITTIKAKTDYKPRHGEPTCENCTSYVPVGLPSCESEYHIDAYRFSRLDQKQSEGGLRRNYESYSSLETLIQRPFDYVTEYLLGWKEYGEAQIQDIYTTKGNVAHLYLQTLVEMADKDTDKMESIHMNQFGKIVKECAEKMGALLLSKENRLEYEKFKITLKKSISELLSLMRLNCFTIIGSECSYDVDLPVIGQFTARIDLVLKNFAGDYVIFDMKWSEGKTYQRKMESGDFLQLAMYSEVLRKSTGCRVAAAGYWIFPQSVLLTDDTCVLGDSVICFADNDDNEKAFSLKPQLFKMACNSYLFRMNQLRRGVVEQGEGLLLANLEYMQNAEIYELYPLHTDFEASNLKACAYGNKNKILKGLLA